MHHGSGCIGPPNTSMWAQAFAFTGRLPSDMVISASAQLPEFLSAISLLDGLARSSKVDQDGLAARSNKRMGTEKVKKEEVVQHTQLDNKSPIQVADHDPR